MEEQTVDMDLSQSRDRSGQETFKKRVALTGAKYVIDKARTFITCYKELGELR